MSDDELIGISDISENETETKSKEETVLEKDIDATLVMDKTIEKVTTSNLKGDFNSNLLDKSGLLKKNSNLSINAANQTTKRKRPNCRMSTGMVGLLKKRRLEEEEEIEEIEEIEEEIESKASTSTSLNNGTNFINKSFEETLEDLLKLDLISKTCFNKIIKVKRDINETTLRKNSLKNPNFQNEINEELKTRRIALRFYEEALDKSILFILNNLHHLEWLTKTKPIMMSGLLNGPDNCLRLRNNIRKFLNEYEKLNKTDKQVMTKCHNLLYWLNKACKVTLPSLNDNEIYDKLKNEIDLKIVIEDNTLDDINPDDYYQGSKSPEY